MEGLHRFWFPPAALRARLQKLGSSKPRPWERWVSESLFLLRTGWSGWEDIVLSHSGKQPFPRS